MSKVAQVELTDTLMAWDNYLEGHVQSGDRSSTYFFRVPDGWATMPQKWLDGKVFVVMQMIYDAFNEHFRQVEPNDINYLAPLAVHCRILTLEEEEQKLWLTAGSPAAWEWTPCVVVAQDDTYKKVEPTEF